MIKKILIGLAFAFVQLIAVSQTAKVQNLQVLGTSSFTGASTFTVRPTFNSNTPYDTGNLTIGNYLTTATAASTYAPIVSPVFTTSFSATGLIGLGNLAAQATNTVLANVSGSSGSPTAFSMPSCSSTTSALQWTSGTGFTCNTGSAPLAGPSFTGVVSTTGSFSGAGTSLTGTAASLTAGTATNLAGGGALQVPYQSAAGTTTFLAAPTVSGTCAQYNGTTLVWATCGSGGGGSGTVTSVAASGGSTGLTFTGTPITTSGTLTLGGLLGVGYGGTGLTTATAHAVLLGEGTSAFAFAAIGTAGNVLVDQGSGTDPKFQSGGPIVLTGADPTGSADSTTAIQNFFNTVVGNGLTGNIPAGTYKLSAAISVPFGVGYVINGNARGGTIFNQTAANTPILNWASGSGGVGGHSFAVNDIYFQWASAPTITQTHSIALAFNNSAETWYDFQFNRITCNNGYECIGIDKASNGTIWGESIRDLVVGGTVCSAFDDSAGGTGAPNISIDGAYLTGSSMNASCPFINAPNNDSSWFNHIEINAAPNGNTILEATGQFAVGTIKVEQGTYTNGQYVFQFPNAHATISALDLEDLTISASGGAVYGIDVNGGGGGSTITVGQVNLTFATGITGTFYLGAAYGGSPSYNLRFISAPSGLIGTANAFLTNVPGTTSDGGVSVDDWQQPRLTANVGDANTTWTASNPNILLYNTTLTANRTVTLNNVASGSDTNLYNGLQVCVLRAAATPGAFTLSVLNSASVQVGQLGSGATGLMCFMWERSLSAWVKSNYSQFNLVSSGQLLNVQTFTSTGTYTPTSGTNSIIVEAVGGGGAGGGAQATSSTQGSMGTGGAAGGYVKSRITSAFSGVTVTIGAGGTGVSGASGNAGGNTTFGALLTASGGGGGQTIAANANSSAGGGGTGGAASGGSILNVAGNSAQGSIMPVATGTLASISGNGASSPFGAGASGSGANTAGVAAASTGYGAGGSGANNSVSQSALSGGAGTKGIVIIYEYN